MKTAKALLIVSIILIVLGFSLGLLAISKAGSLVGAVSTFFGVFSALLGFLLLGLTMLLFAGYVVKTYIVEGHSPYIAHFEWLKETWIAKQRWFPQFVTWIFRIWGLIFTGGSGFLLFHFIRGVLKSL